VIVEELPTAELVAMRGAALIAEAAREAVSLRGAFTMALSGGKTPWVMLRHLTEADMPWSQTQIFQVDERIAPDGSLDRNLTLLNAGLASTDPALLAQVHPMPVTADNLDAAAAEYAIELEKYCGTPAVLDLVHLGLGTDGHTASLVPGDPALEVTDCDVTLTGVYQERRRMTLTYPMLNRARKVLWIVTGAEKAERVRQLIAGDPSIPVGRVASENALLIVEKTS